MWKCVLSQSYSVTVPVIVVLNKVVVFQTRPFFLAVFRQFDFSKRGDEDDEQAWANQRAGIIILELTDTHTQAHKEDVGHRDLLWCGILVFVLPEPRRQLVPLLFNALTVHSSSYYLNNPPSPNTPTCTHNDDTYPTHPIPFKDTYWCWNNTNPNPGMESPYQTNPDPGF